MATHYPLDSDSYKILDNIGDGVCSVVHKAICVPMNSALVAIKSIDLDLSRADFEDVIQREAAKTQSSLLSHPNILSAHCSFTAGRRFWVVMPFMAGGSLQSIMHHSFPEGLDEPCIAAILKEILKALSDLHGKGHVHRDIKAGNILIDSNGHVKLADFGVSASNYESNSARGASSSLSSSSPMVQDSAAPPYWLAPEVFLPRECSSEADIWSFGVTALELAHGGPPLSHLPPFKPMIMKRFPFLDFEQRKKGKHQSKYFSETFKSMVASCLNQEPSRRLTADKLLDHPFFKNCMVGPDFFVRNVLRGLPTVEERYRGSKILQETPKEDEGDDEGGSAGQSVEHKRVIGWSWNEDEVVLDPVFPTESRDAKRVRLGGETTTQDKGVAEEHAVASGTKVPAGTGGAQVARGVPISREAMSRRVRNLMASLNDKVVQVVDEWKVLMEQEISRQRTELEEMEDKNLQLELQLDMMKLLLPSTGDDDDDDEEQNKYFDD